MFYPTWHFRRVQDIPADFLYENHLRCLVLDVDNTLTLHEHPVPSEGVMDWLESLDAAGIRSVILSNNSSARVKPFAEQLGLDFVPDAKKPFTSGYERCRQLFDCAKNEMAAVGDQLLTDVWGGSRYGIATILVDPIQKEDIWFFKCKRAVERILLHRYEKEGRAGYFK